MQDFKLLDRRVWIVEQLTMSSEWEKFKLLLRKNFIIQSRSKFQTALEVLIPVAFCSVLVIIRSLVDIKRYDDPIYYKGLEINNLNYLE